MPYRLYSDEDIATRVIYVEASRGCPYLCAFCLSSLDQKMREVDLDPFFAEMETLLARGSLGFKFIDRTFNLSTPFALRVLDFFYQRMRPGLNLHFEMVPERLPPELIASLLHFRRVPSSSRWVFKRSTKRSPSGSAGRSRSSLCGATSQRLRRRRRFTCI